uniref:Type II GnRH receptor n=1 Tax=Sphenodon punctatus TaxID=8508 RepID=A0A8D0HR29_SPHPU
MNASGGAGPVPWGSLPARGHWPNSSLEGDLALPTFTATAQARVVLTLLLCAVAAGCNVAVLWAGTGGHHAKSSHVRVLLLHLAGADLLVALVVMPLDAAWNITVQWRAGDLACRLFMFLKLLAMYASSFVTVVISLDRQAAILRPLAITEARRRNQLMLYTAWLLSTGLSVPQLFLFHTVTISSQQNFTQCTTHGSFPRRWHETAYNMFSFTGLFLLPLLIMVTCYSRILLEISHRMGPGIRESKELPLRRSRNPIPRARLRMLCLSVAIVSSFLVCWTPYYLLGLWYWFWPAAMEGTVSRSVSHLLFLFGLLNACLDPITYGLFTLPWRRGLGCCCGGDMLEVQSQPPSLATSSFRCSASSFRTRWGAPGLTPSLETPAAPISLESSSLGNWAR